MTDKLENKIKALERDLNCADSMIKALINRVDTLKFKLEQPKEWPQEGDEMFATYGGGKISRQLQYDDRTYRAYLTMGNIHRTREEAEAHVERQQVEYILTKHQHGFVPDWNDREQDKYPIGNNATITSGYISDVVGAFFYSTPEHRTAARDEVGIDRLNKYMGVK